MNHAVRTVALTCAGLLLGACASAPKPSAPPAEQTTSPTIPVTRDPRLPPRTAVVRPRITFPPGTPTVERIVQVALAEHRAWHQPFIDSQGRLASRRVGEAERSRLADGDEPWARVATYWRDSGTLWEMSGREGAEACRNPYGSSYVRNECRGFVSDTAWSAAFISWVMVQAGVQGFRASPRHIDYIRAAWRGEAVSPYRIEDPNQAVPRVGDMLCYVRNNPNLAGFGGLQGFFAGSDGSLPSHCDIVVRITGNEAWLVGGNVANMVTMRKLRLDAQGRAVLPRPISAPAISEEAEYHDNSCSPENEAACSMNRQNWAALLRLVRA
ncbi:DUF2272 domain-containing protein [Luteimonas sp. e5]